MTEGLDRLAGLLGRAAMDIWGDMPRDMQEALFEAAVKGREGRETAETLLLLPFYHPTFEEGLKPALRAICEAVKSLDLGNLDDEAPPGS